MVSGGISRRLSPPHPASARSISHFWSASHDLLLSTDRSSATAFSARVFKQIRCRALSNTETERSRERYPPMGTAGPPGGFDIQNFFKTPPQPSLPGYNQPTTPYPPPNHPFHPSSHNFPPNNFPPPNSYPPSTSAFPNLPGSYSFPSQGSVYHPYAHYPQDHGPRPPPYPSPPFSQPGFSQPIPSPPPSLPHSASPHAQLNLQSPISSPPLDGARLMALLTTHSSGELTVPTSLELPPAALSSSDVNPEVSHPPAAIAPAVPSAPPVSLAPSSGSGRLTSSKLPRGRPLKGEHVVYDVDVRLQGEAQPQLEVSPITVYGSDPELVVGRQIAVNRAYICYGLRAGTIRILNINTALRALLRGHSQRVTDMAFFAEDVHLLASASSDGRVFVRRIVEDHGEEGKTRITEQILLAIQIIGDWESAHPRVCWHSHMQDLLVVGVGKYVLTIDMTKVRLTAAASGFTTEDPVQCSVDNPIEGVHCVSGHDGEVTDLSTSQWTRLASASKDGTVRIWGDKKMLSISTHTPHEGQQVGAVAFLSAPRRPDHIVLLSAGPLNRELKLWVPAGGEGWFPQSGGVKWKCIQTLELKSSTAGKPEEAFFNQVLVVPRACLILLANAKKNAIYVVHVEFGSNPSATRMDYLAEFSVTMPILSLTATSEGVFDGEGVVQVYCVQTQAIQQYSLDLSQCLPPVGEAPAFTLERDLISGAEVPDVSVSNATAATESPSAATAFEVRAILAGGRAKSPGPISGMLLNEKPVGVGKGSLFGGTVDLPGSRDQSPPISNESTAMLDTKPVTASAKKEVKEILMRESSPSIPQIVAPVPQVGSVPLSPRGSPLARSRSKSPVDNGLMIFTSSPRDSPREQVEHLQVYEQSTERKTDSGLPALPDVMAQDSFPLSPQRICDENLRKTEEREWQASSPKSLTTSVMAEQQATSSPVHLITPSELMSMVARSKAEADGGLTVCSPRAAGISKDSSKADIKSEEESMDLEVLKLETKEVTESSMLHPDDTGAEREAIIESSVLVSDTKEKVQTSAGSDYSCAESMRQADIMQRFLPEQTGGEENLQGDEGELDEKDRSVNLQVDEAREQLKEVAVKVTDSPSLPVVLQSPAVLKGRKNKNKTNATGLGAPAVTASSSVQLPNASASNISTSEGESSNGNSISVSSSALAAQIIAMQDSLNQLVAMQKELQKQMTVMVAVPVAKEGKRMEAALGQRMEKVLKAHVDAMWARIQEENAKREKLERDRMQQLTSLLSNSINKDLPAALERALKKEMSLIGPSVARLVTPSIEKAIPTAVNEAFQKGISDKGVTQLEKSVGAKLEAAVSRQLQAQFQTTGRQALQEALRSCFEGTVIPGFERSCRAMFEQVDSAFQKGMSEHTAHAQQQFTASHSALASTLQDTVASASSLAASLKGEMADGQRKLLALVENTGGARSNKQSNGGLPDKVVTVQHLEESLDPTKELMRLVSERKLEEAFNKALSLTDVAVVSWLCNQVDPVALFTTAPLPLSQGVLLSLVQQLGCDLGKDTARKITWIREAALALNPNDPVLAPHMRAFLEQLYQNLHRQMLVANVSGELANSMRLVIHVVNSLLTACK